MKDMKNFALPIGLFLILAATAAAQTGTGTVSPGTAGNQADEIVQFNNLRITEIISSSELRAVINYDVPNPCLKFESLGESRGASFPCPMPLGAERSNSGAPQLIAPQIAYTVKTGSQTIFLLRDRSRASFSDFGVNDRINIYGFYDVDTNTVEALILRNLSKPKERKFIQLNNLDIVSISSSTTPATITAVQNFSHPCYDYGSEGNTSARPTACPMPLKATGVDEMRFPANIYRKYVIEIKNSTTLLDRSKNPIGFSQIALGERINVYGLYDEDTQVIEALILRDLSKPAQRENISGTIIQVNADGSFVLRTDSGEEFTVNPRLATGLRVEVQGFIDRVSKIISELTRLLIKR